MRKIGYLLVSIIFLIFGCASIKQSNTNNYYINFRSDKQLLKKIVTNIDLNGNIVGLISDDFVNKYQEIVQLKWENSDVLSVYHKVNKNEDIIQYSISQNIAWLNNDKTKSYDLGERNDVSMFGILIYKSQKETPLYFSLFCNKLTKRLFFRTKFRFKYGKC